MKTSVRKLISSLIAGATITNVSMLGISAAYIAEQISDSDFDTLIEMYDKNVYIENGDRNRIEDGSRLVVIDRDGNKKTITLEEGINGIRNYVGTTELSYAYSETTEETYDFGVTTNAVYVPTTHAGYFSPYSSDYSFNFYDNNYVINSGSGSMIVGVGDEYALMNSDGEIVSSRYENIYRINDNYYEVVRSEESKYSFGLIDSVGNEIIKPSDRIRAVYLTSDERYFLVDGMDGDYFADLKGNPVSKKYSTINAKSYSNWYGNYNTDEGLSSGYYDENDNWVSMPYFVGGNSNFKVYEPYTFTDEKGKQALSFYSIRPETSFYEAISSSNYGHLLYPYIPEGEDVTFDWYSLFGDQTFKNCSELTVKYVWFHSPDKEDPEYREFILVRQDGRDFVYDEEMHLCLDGENIIFNPYNLTNSYDSQPKSNDIFWISVDGDVKKYNYEFKEVNDDKSSLIPQGHYLQSVYSYLNGDYETEALLYKENDEEYYIYNSDFTKCHEINITPYTTAQNYYSFDTYAYSFHFNKDCINLTIEIYDHSDGNCYCRRKYCFINKDFEIIEFETTGNASGVGNYYLYDATSSSTYVVKDFSGKTYFELDQNNLFEKKGNCYFVTSGAIYEPESKFSIFDDKLNIIAKDVEGGISFEDNNIYGFIDENGNVKYGLINLKNGELSDTVYDRIEFVDKERIIAVRKNRIDIYNCENELIDSIDGEFDTDSDYVFYSLTPGAYYDASHVSINFINTEKHKTTSVVYDLTTKKVLYQQHGKYDFVSDFVNGYAVATKYYDEPSSYYPNKWMSNFEYPVWHDFSFSQCLIKEDGTEIIEPIDNLEMSLYFGYYKVDNIKGRWYTDFDEEILYLPDYECDKIKRNYIKFGQFYAEFDKIDFDFAKKNDVQLAVLLNNGNYVVYKNGKWRVMNSDSEYVGDIAFDGINSIEGNLIEIFNCEEYEYVDSYYDYFDEYITTTFTTYNVYKGIINDKGKVLLEPNLLDEYWYSPIKYYNGIYHVRDGIVGQSYYGGPLFSEFKDFVLTDMNNDFTKKYGYDSAVKNNGLYLVEKDGLYGVVTKNNEEIIPIEYAGVLKLPLNEFINIVKWEDYERLSEDRYTSPIDILNDGTGIIHFKTQDGKIRAFRITNTETSSENIGDMNDDGRIDASDASTILKIYALLSTGSESQVSDEMCILGDVNRDGRVDASDASYVLGYYAHLSTGGTKTLEEFIR